MLNADGRAGREDWSVQAERALDIEELQAAIRRSPSRVQAYIQDLEQDNFELLSEVRALAIRLAQYTDR